MENYQIADRFGRRPQPKLSLRWTVCSTSGDGFRLRISIANEGKGTATLPAISFDRSSVTGCSEVKPFAPLGIASPPDKPGEWITYGAGVDKPIYPELRIAALEVGCVTALAQANGVKLNYRLYCEGFGQSGTLEITGPEIIAGMGQLRSRT